jgi:hypothetical protein
MLFLCFWVRICLSKSFFLHVLKWQVSQLYFCEFFCVHGVVIYSICIQHKIYLNTFFQNYKKIYRDKFKNFILVLDYKKKYAVAGKKYGRENRTFWKMDKKCPIFDSPKKVLEKKVIFRRYMCRVFFLKKSRISLNYVVSWKV